MVDFDDIRNKLIAQIDSVQGVDENQKSSLKEKIVNSSNEELLELVRQQTAHDGPDSDNNCIFCGIVSGKVQSYKIRDDDHSVMVLDINPASRGHSLIIPRAHGSFSSMPDDLKPSIKFACDLLVSKLSPSKVDVSTQEVMGHTLINIIPIYPGAELDKQPASKDDLESLRVLLTQTPIKLDVKKEVVVVKDDSPPKRVRKVSKPDVKSKKPAVHREKTRSRIP
jgi:hypothetical protein